VKEHRSTVEEVERRWFVRLGMPFVRSFAFVFHGLRVVTPCPLPPRAGGAILVCNHTSSLDPVLLQAAAPRIITWMMAKEYARIPGMRVLMNGIEPILVERSGRDMAATRSALRALKDGKILGLFPEGKIETTPKLLEFQTGVALLAMKSGAPVYPAYLDGTQRCKSMMEGLFKPHQITLAFGPPVDLQTNGEEGREALESATERIRAAVAALENVK
jgi:1-acyl-sn-glycerol-3-phosphate acyltransferase